MCFRIFRHVHFWKLFGYRGPKHISYIQRNVSASIVISLGHPRFYRSAYVMLGPSYPCLKKVAQEAVFARSGAVTLWHAAIAAQRNEKPSVTSNKFLKVVVDVWMN
jgi:hypothetical protein